MAKFHVSTDKTIDQSDRLQLAEQAISLIAIGLLEVQKT
jgi:hypothetical protein